MTMPYLVADAAQVTVLRSLAAAAFGKYSLTVPDGVDMADIHTFAAPGNELGYVADLQTERVGGMARRFVRADVAVKSINPGDPTWTPESNVDAVLREVEERVASDFFLESDITIGGLGDWVPFVDFEVGDPVRVEIWGRVVVLRVTRIEPIISDHSIVDWRVHVGGQLVSDEQARLVENESIRRAVVEDRRELAGLESQVGQAVADASSAKASAAEALSKIDVVEDKADLVLEAANGKSTNFYGDVEPDSAVDGDAWFKRDPDTGAVTIYQRVNGAWVKNLDSAEIDAEIKAKLDTAQYEQKMTQLDSSLATLNKGLDAAEMDLARKINKGEVQASDLVAGAVTAGKIASGAVTTDSLAANAVTAGKVAANAITAKELAANSVTSDHLTANSVLAGNIKAGAVGADQLAANAVKAGNIDADAISARHIQADALSAREIKAEVFTQVGTNVIPLLPGTTVGAWTKAADASGSNDLVGRWWEFNGRRAVGSANMVAVDPNLEYDFELWVYGEGQPYASISLIDQDGVDAVLSGGLNNNAYLTSPDSSGVLRQTATNLLMLNMTILDGWRRYRTRIKLKPSTGFVRIRVINGNASNKTGTRFCIADMRLTPHIVPQAEVDALQTKSIEANAKAIADAQRVLEEHQTMLENADIRAPKLYGYNSKVEEDNIPCPYDPGDSTTPRMHWGTPYFDLWRVNDTHYLAARGYWIGKINVAVNWSKGQVDEWVVSVGNTTSNPNRVFLLRGGAAHINPRAVKVMVQVTTLHRMVDVVVSGGKISSLIDQDKFVRSRNGNIVTFKNSVYTHEGDLKRVKPDGTTFVVKSGTLSTGYPIDFYGAADGKYVIQEWTTYTSDFDFVRNVAAAVGRLVDVKSADSY